MSAAAPAARPAATVAVAGGSDGVSAGGSEAVGFAVSTRCEKFCSAVRSLSTAEIQSSSKASGSWPRTEKMSPKRWDNAA